MLSNFDFYWWDQLWYLQQKISLGKNNIERLKKISLIILFLFRNDFKECVEN